MDLDVICIDDKWPEDEAYMYHEYCIETPIFGERYSIREFVKNPDGTYGVLFNEIHNVDNMIAHRSLRLNTKEPNWDLKYFVMVDREHRAQYRNLKEFYINIILQDNIKPAMELIDE